MEVFMNCVFCGEEIIGRPIRQDGQVYCSIDCLDTATEVGIDQDDYEMEEVPDDGLDLDYFEEADEY
jgi:hypothetical protein